MHKNVFYKNIYVKKLMQPFKRFIEGWSLRAIYDLELWFLEKFVKYLIQYLIQNVKIFD